MTLKVYLLGQFKLQVDAQELELPSRPAQSLLAYLALNAGVTQRREKLAGQIWPEASESNARGYLRQALWRIRKCLGSGGLDWEAYLKISDIDVVFLKQSDYWLDAEQLLSEIAEDQSGELSAVLEIYVGELLPGFYDEWVEIERDRLAAAFQQKINLLLESLVAAGEWQAALRWSENWIRLGGAPEPAYRAMMRAYAGLGDAGMVRATYQRCEGALERELGLEPSPETRQLYEQIRQADLETIAPKPVSTPQVSMTPPSFLDQVEPRQVESPLFVAREQELDQLESHLQAALAGQGRVVFVTGEAGSGKTALIEAFTQRVLDKYSVSGLGSGAGVLVARGKGNAHTGIGDPYLPFREILEMIAGDVEARYAAGVMSREHAQLIWQLLPATTRILVESGPDLINTFVPGRGLYQRASAIMPSETGRLTRLRDLIEVKASGSVMASIQQSDLFKQYTRVLTELAREITLIIVVDDLQWADTGSFSLLFHLGRNLPGCRILVVGAYRPEEIALGRGGERHPLEPVVNELTRDLGDIMINVDQAERREFLDALLDSEPNCLDSAFRQMLYRQTRGQPLFTIELLRGMQERGDLILDQDGLYGEGPELDWETLPARVEAVIAERIGRLDQSLQDALRVASVEGESFTAEVVARVSGMPESELLGRLSGELDRRHRLVTARSIQRIDGQLLSNYRFRHILTQRYLYASLDEVERVHVHEQVGVALEALYAGTEGISAIAVQLARHFQEAWIKGKAIHYLHQAGEKAVRLSAYQEALTHLSNGLDLVMTLPESAERDQHELDLQILLGMAIIGGRGFVPEVKETYTRSRELSRKIGSTAQLCHVLGELSIYHYVLAEYRQAYDLALEALELAHQIQDPLLIVAGSWFSGCVSFGRGDFQTARTHLATVIDYYDPEQHHDPLILLRGSDAGLGALAYDACCLWCLGYPDQAAEGSQTTISLAKKLGHPFSLADALYFAGCIFHKMTRDAHALMISSEEMLQLASEILPGWSGGAILQYGSALILDGKVDEGIDQIRFGLEAEQFEWERCYRSSGYCSLALGLGEVGQPGEGLRVLTKAYLFVEETDERIWEAELYRVQGELELMLDDEARAEASFLKAIEIARGQRAKSWELRASTSLARLWMQQGKPEEARHMLSQVYDWFTEGFDTPDLIEARELLDKLG